MKRASTLFALLAAAGAAWFGGAPLAAEPVAQVAFEPSSVTLGDRVAATVSVRLDPGDARSPRFPDWTRGWGKLNVLSASAATRVESPRGVEWRLPLELAAFELGKLELPPLTIELAGELPAPDAARSVVTPAGLAIEVRSVLPAQGGPVEPAPADPPRALPVPRAFWSTAGSLALVAAALALLVARRRRAQRTGESAAALAPMLELERALRALAAAEPVAAHALLSIALRRFLGRTLSLPAAESTTSELAQRLASRPLDRATIQRAVRLLRDLDQVKFARRPTGADELARRVEEARAVAFEVERQMAPPAAEAAA